MFSHHFKKKYSNKKNFVFLGIFFLVSNFLTKSVLAWSGYDFDSKTTIEIEQGNLVKEGLIIQFYDYNLDKYHNAKINFIDSVVDGTRIQLEDLDAKKERTFIMHEN